MKIISLISTILFLASFSTPAISGGGLPVSVVQSVGGGNNYGSTTASTSFPSSNTAGDTIVVLIQWSTGSGTAEVSSVTDTKGNSYTIIPNSFAQAGPTAHDANIYTQIAYATNVVAGSNTVTVTWNSSVGGFASLFETSPSLFNQASTGSGTGSSISAGGFSTAVSGAFAVATSFFDDGVGSSNVFNAGSGWTMFQNAGGGSASQGGEYRLQAAAGSLTGNFTSSVTGSWVASMAAFVPSGAADTQAPTVPTGLVGDSVLPTQINLAWTASTDMVGVEGYDIFRNGTQVGTSNTTTYSDTGLTASTTYTYAVSAYNFGGLSSAQSTSISVTTQTTSSGGSNIYIAQNITGTGDGSSCADANPVTWFNTSSNWASTPTPGKIGPGTTVHLCGTITGGGTLYCSDGSNVTCGSTFGTSCGTAGTCVNPPVLSVQGSGTVGNPITIRWESGAVVSQPASGFRGLINIEEVSNIIFDGNPTGVTIPCGWVNGADVACNGTIENTANGDNQTYQTSTSGIYDQNNGAANIEIRNLNFENLYVKSNSNITGGGGGTAIVTGTSSPNYLNIHNCNFTQSVVLGTTTTGTLYFYNNYMENVGSGVSGVAAVMDIHGNYFGDMNKYDTPLNSTCTGAGAPWTCCTGVGTGNCPDPNLACSSAGSPMSCCTGFATGTCEPANQYCSSNGTATVNGTAYAASCCTGAGIGSCVGFGTNSCLANGVPWSCCTGPGAGSCPEYDGGSGCNDHMDGVHFWTEGSQTLAGNIYNNQFTGNMGNCANNPIMVEYGPSNGGAQDSEANINIFNNVFTAYSPRQSYGLMDLSNGCYSGCYTLNNTFAGQTFGWIAFGPESPNGYFKNNLIDNFDADIDAGAGAGFASGGLNNNMYVNGNTGTPFVTTASGGSNQWYSFSGWQSVIGQDQNSSAPTTVDLNSNGSLQSGSPAIGAGTNLTSSIVIPVGANSSCLSSGNPWACCTGAGAGTCPYYPLDSDVNGTARPSSGAWDIGAYQYSSGSSSIIYGDVNGDGQVTIYDAFMVAQYAVGLVTLTPAQMQAAEVSSSTETNPTVYDAFLIAQYAVGLITKFPVQP